jgi:hypothetical protein
MYYFKGSNGNGAMGGFKGEVKQGFNVSSLVVGLLKQGSQQRPRMASETREWRVAGCSGCRQSRLVRPFRNVTIPS